ncbi:MAG: redoxin domain-containing protein, partial [Melioribacteraceae bacterium]|nr:redoxin domain-containing protein [Melioribacteraceae bacterium]
DPVESHQKFNFKYDFSFPLLSDSDKSVSKSFNALNFLNRNKRKLVLLNRNKIILFSKTVFPFRFLSYESLLSKIVE